MEDIDKELLDLPLNLYRSAISIRSEITRRLSKVFGEEFTADYWFVLNYIVHHQPVAINNLAKLMGRDKGSISRTVNCMERIDLICRSVNPANKKSVLISVTNVAQQFMEKAEVEIKSVVENSLGAFRPIEMLELNRMLQTIVANMTE
ncbi:MAG TPA: MarR family winged helix-turn-helix transcriptional regulator [Tenuifilaceae bacterium]|nr:MarR family winged helix-turn-helix transcriptional regulator [Tenuifilaceae bacterium]